MYRIRFLRPLQNIIIKIQGTVLQDVLNHFYVIATNC